MEDLKYWWFPVGIFLAIMIGWGITGIIQDTTRSKTGGTTELHFRIGYIAAEAYDASEFAGDFANKHPDWAVRPGTYANKPVYWVYCEKPAPPVQFVEQGYWERWPTTDK